MTFVIINRDTERDRWMYWMCDMSGFGYYEEHATKFDNLHEADVVRKYCKTGGEIRPFPLNIPEQS